MALSAFSISLIRVNVEGTQITLPNTEVRVYEGSSLTLAQIFSDESGTIPISQPAFSDADGVLEFYAEVERYEASVLGTRRPINDASVIVKEDSISGDEQVVSGKIWPESSLESASDGDTLTGYDYVRLSGGDFVDVTLFPVVKKSGDRTPLSGSLTSINLTTRPYSATVGTDDVWLLDVRYWHLPSNDVAAGSFWTHGNWDVVAQTGTDDSPMLNAWMDYIGKFDYRNGGGSRGYLQSGSYLADSTLLARSQNGLGFMIVGAGRSLSTIYSNVGTGLTDYLFDSNVEELVISGIQAQGNITGSPSDPKSSLIFAQSDDGAADVDLRLTECQFNYFQDGARVKGRGFTAIGCGFGHINEVLVIESPNPWVQKGSSDTDSQETGMRNYLLSSCRLDAIGSIVTTLGTGPAQNYIHGVTIEGCTGTVIDRAFSVGARLGVTPTSGRLIGSGITDCEFLFSFATGVVEAFDLENITISSNRMYKLYNPNLKPSSSAETISQIVKAHSSINGLTVSDNNVGPIERCAVECLGAVCRDVTLSDNNLRDLFYFVSAAGSNRLMRIPTDSRNVVIHDNVLDSGGQTITETNLYLDPITSALEVSIRGNRGDVKFEPFNNSYDPKIIIGGDDTLATYSVQNGRWSTDENYVDAQVNVRLSAVSGTPSGGDSIRVSLPVPAIQDPGVGTSFSSGSGDIGVLENVTLTAGELVQSIVAFNNNEYGDVKVMTTTGQRNLNYGNISPTSFQLSFNIRYRYK